MDEKDSELKIEFDKLLDNLSNDNNNLRHEFKEIKDTVPKELISLLKKWG